MVEKDNYSTTHRECEHSEHNQTNFANADRLRDEAFLVPHSNTNSTHSERVQNDGAIEELNLPPGWHKANEQEQIAGLGSASTFHKDKAGDSEFVIFNRNQRYDNDANAFKKVLEKEPHTLSAAEKESMPAILNMYGDPRAFNMHECKTENVNGKSVLIIEGEWTANKNKSLTMLANPDGSGKTVQEIVFKAPSGVYDAEYAKVDKSMKSVQWK